MNQTCNHNTVRFEGMFSMIGSYVCQDCRMKIEPFVLHAFRKEHHVLFQEEYAEKLKEMVNNLDEENYKLWIKATT
jgi:hypothetical protein